MHIKSAWSYVNKGLLIILSFLVISTLSSVVYLIYTLQSLHSFTRQGTNAVATAFVLQDLLINMQDVENSVRGYIITGDPAFLARYDNAKDRIPTNLRIIKTDKNLLLTGKQAQEIATLSNQKLDRMKQVVAIEHDEGFENAQAFVSTKQGETIMNNLRNQITSISSVGLGNIGPLRTNSEANLHRALYVAGTLGVFVVGACVAVMWYFQRAILRERALESTKNEFLSLASHQLRTPATNVKQYLALLMDGYMGDLTEQQRHALSVAYKNNESEISIMNNLLDVAKLDLERIQLHKKVTNIMSIVQHVVHDHRTIGPRTQADHQSCWSQAGHGSRR
jgi:CHASE3 domain sensor protein